MGFCYCVNVCLYLWMNLLFQGPPGIPGPPGQSLNMTLTQLKASHSSFQLKYSIISEPCDRYVKQIIPFKYDCKMKRTLCYAFVHPFAHRITRHLCVSDCLYLCRTWCMCPISPTIPWSRLCWIPCSLSFGCWWILLMAAKSILPPPVWSSGSVTMNIAVVSYWDQISVYFICTDW